MEIIVGVTLLLAEVWGIRRVITRPSVPRERRKPAKAENNRD